MRGYLCYSAKPSDFVNGKTTNDLALESGFISWLIGEHTMPVEKNPVLHVGSFVGYSHTPLEIWRQVEKCQRKAESKETKQHFKRIAEKYKNKTIYSL